MVKKKVSKPKVVKPKKENFFLDEAEKIENLYKMLWKKEV